MLKRMTTAIAAMLLVSSLYAQEEDVPKLVPDAMISGANHRERSAASSSLAGLRNQVSRELLANLGSLLDTEDRAVIGPLHLTIDAIGQWRIEEAVPQLLLIIDLQLDPRTAPAGSRIGAVTLYPAANALGKIGGPAVIDGVLEKTREPIPELSIRCCAFVLQKAVGSRRAVVIAEAELAKFGTEETSPNLKGLRANLGKLVELLKSDKPVLTMPK